MIEGIVDLAEMPLLVHGLIAIFCFGFLWLGSELTVFGARGLAAYFGIPELIVGLTIMSVISSLPEIAVNIAAALEGADDIAAGNVVGSCFVQISFILGLCILLAGRIEARRSGIIRDGSVLLAANLSFLIVAADQRISVTEGTVLIAAYLIYLLYIVLREVRNISPSNASQGPEIVEPTGSGKLLLRIVQILGGSAIVWLTAETLVATGSDAGVRLGVSEGLIGLWTGVGTSIPEMAISVVAILRGANRLSMGNLVGSNITDPLLSLGIGAVVAIDLNVSQFISTTAAASWLAATLFVLVSAWFNRGLARISATFLIVGYLISQYLFALSG